MNKENYESLTVAELLVMTQTNVTPDPNDGLEIASFGYNITNDSIEKGTFASQAGFRAEQADKSVEIVYDWFNKSREALSSDDERIKRELIATELLTGRAIALRIERIGSKTVELADLAKGAFYSGEDILRKQHNFGRSWDRFGTMLSRHRATYESMNGDAGFAAMTSIQGIWRAVRAQRESNTLKEHTQFVIKQIGMNAAAGVLAVSNLFDKSETISVARHKYALKLLGGKPSVK